MKEFDTICAIATPIGEGGVAIIRISGENALDIASRIFKPKNHYDIKNMKTYTMKYGNIVDLEKKEIIDEVICEFNYKLDINKSKQLRELSKSGKLNKVTAVDVFEGRYKKPKTSSKPSVKAVTLKPKFLSKYYAADVPQNVIEEEIETSIDVWQKIKDKFNGLSVEEIKEQVENLLEENI